jgi:hypothetical protein
VASAFTDQAVEPTAEAVAEALGPAQPAWGDLQRGLDAVGAALAPWRYYRDGGWLLKAHKGSKTIAWIAIANGHIDMACHFAERLRDAAASAPGVPADVAETIRSAQPRAGLVSVAFELRSADDVDRAVPVLRAKVALK